MTFSPKTLGLAMIAAFVASALLASAAHAEEKTPTFTGGVGLQRETGSQVEQHEITVNAGTIKCTEANLLDKSGNGGMMLLMEPTYVGCTLGGAAATVKMNGCEYTFEPIKTKEEDKYTGRMGIVCKEGTGPIEISKTGCLITIEGQINLETVELVNNTKAEPVKDETWRTEIKKAKYMQTGALCNGGSGIFENLTYNGSTTVKGETNGGEPVDLWIGD